GSLNVQHRPGPSECVLRNSGASFPTSRAGFGLPAVRGRISGPLARSAQRNNLRAPAHFWNNHETVSFHSRENAMYGLRKVVGTIVICGILHHVIETEHEREYVPIHNDHIEDGPDVPPVRHVFQVNMTATTQAATVRPQFSMHAKNE